MMGEVAPLGGGGENEIAQADKLRASHEDRDRVVEVLRVAAGDGRLTADELDQRLEAALTARTYGELALLTRDLPAAGQPAAAVLSTGGPPPAPKEVVRIDCGSGNAVRDRRWIVPQRIEVKVSSGNVVLDFTEAVITAPALQIDAQVKSGNLVLITKPGIVVDADDVAIRSGNVRIREPWGPGLAAAFRISVSGTVASGNIVARPPRRTFWQWLRRAPRPYQIAAG